jgi:hypothetical protein
MSSGSEGGDTDSDRSDDSAGEGILERNPFSSVPICMFHASSKVSVCNTIAELLPICVREHYGKENVASAASKMEKSRAHFFELTRKASSELTFEEINSRAADYISYVDSLAARFNSRRTIIVRPTEEEFMARLRIEWSHWYVVGPRVAIASLKAERSCILFNVGAFLSFHAMAPSPVRNGRNYYVLQTRAFRQAAAVFSGLADTVCACPATHSVHEFRDKSFMTRLRDIMLAHGQQTLYYSALASDASTDEEKAALAQLCSDCYSEVSSTSAKERSIEEVMNERVAGGGGSMRQERAFVASDELISIPPLWRAVCMALATYFRAVAVYHSVVGLLRTDKKKPSQCVAYLEYEREALKADYEGRRNALRSERIPESDKVHLRDVNVLFAQNRDALGGYIQALKEEHYVSGATRPVQFKVKPYAQRLSISDNLHNLFSEMQFDDDAQQQRFPEWYIPSALKINSSAAVVRPTPIMASKLSNEELEYVNSVLYACQQARLYRLRRSWNLVEVSFLGFLHEYPDALFCMLVGSHRSTRDSFLYQLLETIRMDVDFQERVKIAVNSHALKLETFKTRIKSIGSALRISDNEWFESASTDDYSDYTPVNAAIKNATLQTLAIQCARQWGSIKRSCEVLHRELRERAARLRWIASKTLTELLELFIAPQDMELWQAIVEGRPPSTLKRLLVNTVQERSFYARASCPAAGLLHTCAQEVITTRQKHMEVIGGVDVARAFHMQVSERGTEFIGLIAESVMDAAYSQLQGAVDKLAQKQLECIQAWKAAAKGSLPFSRDAGKSLPEFFDSPSQVSVCYVITRELYTYERLKETLKDSSTALESLMSSIERLSRRVDAQRGAPRGISKESVVPAANSLSFRPVKPQDDILLPPLDEPDP